MGMIGKDGAPAQPRLEPKELFWKEKTTAGTPIEETTQLKVSFGENMYLPGPPATFVGRWQINFELNAVK